MNLGVTTVLVGGVIGVLLAAFGARMLITGRAPASTARSFRSVRDAAMYHLLFGIGLIVLVAGTSLGSVAAAISAVVAVVLVATAVVRHRPRRPQQADPSSK